MHSYLLFFSLQDTVVVGGLAETPRHSPFGYKATFGSAFSSSGFGGGSSNSKGGSGSGSSSKKQRQRAKEVLRNEPECGISKQSAFSKRIIGGDRAKFAELPWQVRCNISPARAAVNSATYEIVSGGESLAGAGFFFSLPLLSSLQSRMAPRCVAVGSTTTKFTPGPFSAARATPTDTMQ